MQRASEFFLPFMYTGRLIFQKLLKGLFDLSEIVMSRCYHRGLF
jgi:hypothetical protein